MSLFGELKRRNVFRVGIAYVLLGWALLQGADFVLDLVGAPDWVIRALAVVVAIGLPIALFFAWAFELTPEGIKRESEVDRSASLTPQTGRRLDRAIIVFLVLVIAIMGLERFWPGREAPTGAGSSAAGVSAETPASPAEAATGKSIAVLPFVNMSPDPDNEFFSDGVSEEILNVLAAVPDLKVASRTSAFRYKGSDLGIAEIATALGVTHVLEGSVRKSGDQVRITAQLIQASDGFHLWSDTYDRELTNIFAIQDEIAGSIANVLRVQLLGSGKNYTETDDLSPGDYEKFLKARFLMRQRNDAAMAEAESLTREVLDAAPDFPRGLAQLAEILTMSDADNDGSGPVEVEELANRALALEPDLAAAHMILGNQAGFQGEPLEAIQQLRKAIELDPAEPRPHHWLGIILANTGYLEEARQALETAVDLEPDHANANGYLGFVYQLQGDFERALFHFERQEQLGNDFSAPRKVHIAVQMGDFRMADELVRTMSVRDALWSARMPLFVDAARNPEALPTYLDFVSEHHVPEFHLGTELMILGQFEQALAIDVGGYPRFAWAEYWAEARALPAFDELVQAVDLPEVWNALGPPPACRKLDGAYDCAMGSAP